MSSSLRDVIEDDDVVSEIFLKLKHPSTLENKWILVEGETDQGTYQRIFGDSIEVVAVKGGVSKLLELIKRFEEKHQNVIAIRDLDFTYIVQDQSEAGVFVTDNHDLEMTILSFKNIIEGFLTHSLSSASNKSKAKELKMNSNKLTKKICGILLPISQIKLVNFKEDRQLKFKSISFKYIKRNGELEIDIDDFIKKVNQRSDNKTKPISLKCIKGTKIPKADLFKVTNGHDFIKVLRFILNEEVLLTKKMNEEFIQSNLFCLFQKGHFKKTKLYKSLKDCGFLPTPH